jgi:hypothetical protein
VSGEKRSDCIGVQSEPRPNPSFFILKLRLRQTRFEEGGGLQRDS